MSELLGALTPKTTTDPIVDQLVEEFARRLQSGSPLDIEEFAKQHPEQAAHLRRILPAMQVLADLDATADPGPGSGVFRAAIEPLGDFRLVREVGRGGMGIVYEAEQMSLGRRVALKLLPFTATMDARHMQRFQNEARAAASLEHPHIVPVYAVGCERGIHYYAMKYIDGQTLAALIAQQQPQSEDAPAGQPAASCREPGAETVPVARARTERAPHDIAYFRRAAEWGIQAALALEHSHSVGVVHRDIKPANLMIDARGKLWVADFGLARAASDTALTMTGDLVGTLRYMSPEQALAGRGVVDHRTDIYSLGVTLYELLTLRPAFAAPERGRLLQQIEVEEPVPPRRVNKSIPVELETIVHKAMDKNPADRYRAAQELADDLGRYLEDKPIRARRPSLGRRLKGWCRRHKPLVAGLVVFMATVLLLGAAGLWWQEQQSAAEGRQRAATADAVRKNLSDADFWQERDDWPQALKALGTASGRLQGSGLGALQNQVEKRLGQAALVAQLNDAQVLASEIYADGTRSFGASDRAYAKAFADHSLDVAVLAPGDIAGRVHDSAIRARLVTALDHWAYIKERLPKGDGEPLRVIARLADDDGWRKQLRDPEAVKDLDRLRRLAEEQRVLDQPPVNLLLLCYSLDRIPVTPDPWSPADQAINSQARKTGLDLLRRAWDRYPSDFWINLELAARSYKDDPDAIGYLRAALARQPRNVSVYLLLAGAFFERKRYPEAEKAMRKVTQIQDDHFPAHNNLGQLLSFQKRFAEAIPLLRKAVALQPDLPGPNWNLGMALRHQGEFIESLAFLQRAHELGSADLSFRTLSVRTADELRAGERLIALDAKLPKVWSGEIEPSDAVERVALAEVCTLPCRKYYALAVRLYSEAFAAESKLADNLLNNNRYKAACAAALAGCGQGKDADKLEPEEYAHLRGQAIAWLKADLAVWPEQLKKLPQKAGPYLLRELRRWQADKDFNGVRGAAALAKLPETERRDWQELWEEVEELLKRAAETK
jgi:serine/threonine protein kinase